MKASAVHTLWSVFQLTYMSNCLSTRSVYRLISLFQELSLRLKLLDLTTYSWSCFIMPLTDNLLFDSGRWCAVIMISFRIQQLRRYLLISYMASGFVLPTLFISPAIVMLSTFRWTCIFCWSFVKDWRANIIYRWSFNTRVILHYLGLQTKHEGTAWCL